MFLGADGLSSSAYGPEETFRAIGEHHYVAVALAAAMMTTILVISVAYSQIIKRFPFGGGGYVVATKLLGPRWGVVSGSALLVDYVLTISVSIASGADQILSEPKVHTARKTMTYMGLSLAFTATGILLLYMLFHVAPEEGKTMNASLIERFARDFPGPLRHGYVWITLASESALLFVAAQAGVIRGPRGRSERARGPG